VRRLTAFENVSLDGFFVDAAGEMSWAHAGSDDPDFAAFVAANASGGGELLLGRKTYELMAAWWPTPMAREQDPAVAAGMNAMRKHVASRTLREPAWENTTLLAGDLAPAVRALVASDGPDLAILGSGSLVAQLAEAGLVDVVQLVVNPVVLGAGRSLFEGVPPFRLRLESTRGFANGKVVLTYVRADAGGDVDSAP
jgi:dihydrofolate reductase